ncbi:MAG: UDP-2,4-diacetamido-2,4,6-trideoxy-beta-L-altropyranose hydrolase [Terriglobales bacterium]|jgi:UDP-2,4-diacetamido-2,4,6-trideoxy-beta-L-altropyranose hydrolase
MPPGTLIIRADANVSIGIGHVMRCLGIAQAWQDIGGKCLLAAYDLNPSMEGRVRSEGIAVINPKKGDGGSEDASELVELARQENAEWVVVDGYHFNTAYQRAVKAAGFKLLFADDYGHARSYVADIVLNQNAGASETLYQQREPYTQLLLGLHYFGLRREFEKWGRWERNIPQVARKVLVSMGGADLDNVSLQVLEALQAVENENLEVVLVIGGNNPHRQSLEHAASLCNLPIRGETNPARMPELMVWSEFAVSAGGGTCYELAFLQVPMLLITIAQNHEHTCQVLAAEGAAIHAGWFHSLDRNRLAMSIQKAILDRALRKSLIENGRRLVDGKGAQRVVKSMTSVGSNGMSM